MSKKFRFLSCLIAVFALALMAVSPVAFAGPNENANENASKSEESSSNGSENTPGNDRKEGYEDNSKTPQESNHGQGSDRDGDADSDSNTAYNEDNDTNDGGTPNNVPDDGDNRHPSGKDRSVENGGSGNQGRSESNPDDSKGPMRYEGVQGDDKPNGPGGSDLADQDGNNGCGNDDDFDDDNNGWCGKPSVRGKSEDKKPPKVCDADATMPGIQKCETTPDEVQAGVITRPCDKDDNMANGIQPCDKDKEEGPEVEVQPGLVAQPAQPTEGVLGIRLSKAPAVAAAVQPAVAAQPAVQAEGAVLPFTGGEALIFLAAALALIAAGVVALKVRGNEA